MMTTMRWTGAWRLVLALLAAFGWAEQIMAEKSGKFMVRTWGMESGLPHPRVKALAQTDDGYLWAATSRGLARFDGQRFVVFDDTVHPGLREVSALASGRDNRLWLGCENGAILECREGRFRTVLPADTPGLGKTIMILAEEGNGHLWITTGNFRVSVLRNGSLDQLSERWVGSFGSGFQARCTRDKRLIVNSHLGLWEPVNDSLRSIIRFDGKYHGYHAPGSGDRFWLSDSKHLFRWRGGNPEEAKPLAAPAWGVRKLMFGIEDINSQLWLATDGHGLLSYGEDGTMSEVGISDGLGAGYILSLLEDREGCVWAGTDGGGLSRVQPRVFTRWDHADGLVSNRVNAVLSTRDGSLVIGTKGDGTMRLKNGRVERVGDSSARWMTTDVAALAETPDGKLWIGTWNAGLLFCEGEKCSAATSLPAPNSSVPALLTDPDGSLWVGRSGNPHLLRIGPQGTEVFPLKSGALDVRALAKADDGWLWIGTEADGLFRWKDGKTEALGIPAGQRMTGMRSILAQGDTLWIGTDGAGFWRWKNGSFQTCATADGLPDDNVRGIRIDAAGGMWVSCVKGLVRIDVASLNAWFDGRGSFPAPVVFGESDGVAGIGGYGDGQSCSAAGSDGTFWFATIGGVIEARPSFYRMPVTPPGAVLEDFLVDGAKSADGARIPPGARRIEFRFTGIGLANPEALSFECKLDSVDPEWVPLGNQRTTAYSSLPPGSHHFQVRVKDRYGRVGAPAAAVTFTTLAPFWKTDWFTLAVALTALAIIILIARIITAAKLRHVREQARIDEALANERSRIARDMHDQLGAGLTELAMLGDHLKYGQPDNEDAVTVSHRSRDLIRTMDETVWALNPRNDSVESLISYLTRAVNEWTRHSSVRCRFDLMPEFEEAELRPDVRHSIYLACKEAVHNVLKHSGAGEMLVRAGERDGWLEIEIADNGRGFPSDGRVEGNGLPNLRERMRQLGGELILGSSPDGGASVTLRVKLAICILTRDST